MVNGSRARRGMGTLGCLVSIFVVIALGYVGVNAGQPFVDNYRFQDRMAQEASFAANRSDMTIKARLREYADSLGLPDSARTVDVRRQDGTVEISADYHVRIRFPGFVREQHFTPRAVGSY